MTTLVNVTHVEPAPGQTVWTAEGYEEGTGRPVRFAGDWRPMRDLAEAVEAGVDPVVELEPWQII